MWFRRKLFKTQEYLISVTMFLTYGGVWRNILSQKLEEGDVLNVSPRPGYTELAFTHSNGYKNTIKYWIFEVPWPIVIQNVRVSSRMSTTDRKYPIMALIAISGNQNSSKEVTFAITRSRHEKKIQAKNRSKISKDNQTLPFNCDETNHDVRNPTQ